MTFVFCPSPWCRMALTERASQSPWPSRTQPQPLTPHSTPLRRDMVPGRGLDAREAADKEAALWRKNCTGSTKCLFALLPFLIIFFFVYVFGFFRQDLAMQHKVMVSKVMEFSASAPWAYDSTRGLGSAISAPSTSEIPLIFLVAPRAGSASSPPTFTVRETSLPTDQAVTSTLGTECGAGRLLRTQTGFCPGWTFPLEQHPGARPQWLWLFSG